MSTCLEFYDRIKRLTKAKGLTIESMLDLAFPDPDNKVSRSVYNGWRSRELYPRTDQTHAIAKILNTTVESLISGEEEQNMHLGEYPELENITFTLLRNPELIPRVEAYIDGLLDHASTRENSSQSVG